MKEGNNMEICTRTHEECQKCFTNCDYRTNKNIIAINISKLSIDLMRSIEHNDETYISNTLDEIINTAKYFKEIFNV
jgi:hypothetical protein